MKRAVTYARFSTDKQSDASLEDQSRNCVRYAERAGFQIVHRFEDRAISGSSKSRAGFNAMVTAAGQGEFDILLVDDLSRLSRDDVEMKQLIKRFKFRHIRIIGVSDGYDSDTKGEKIQSTMRGLMNEMYLDDLREKTHRGLLGKALNGFSAGGRCYGYTRIPIEHPTKLDTNGRPAIEAVKRSVNEEEAVWVRKIFEWYADGRSARWIAAELNRQQVKSPRNSTWAASAIYGDMTKGTGLLNNEMYSGRYIWNRSEWQKDPDTGKRRRMNRPESDWALMSMPELQIVPTELWQKVKRRQAAVAAGSVRIRAALQNPNSRSRSGKYLLSGLLKCGCCGANLTVHGLVSYACANNLNRGGSVCNNRLRIPRLEIERQVIDCVKTQLFTEEAFHAFTLEAQRLLKQAETSSQPKVEALKAEVSKAKNDIQNLLAAIKAGIITKSTKDELEKAERSKDAAEKAVKQEMAPSKSLPKILPGAKAKYQSLLKELDLALARDVLKAREILKALVGDVRLVPKGQKLVAEIGINQTTLIELSPCIPPNIQVVAGTGFEPVTFRL